MYTVERYHDISCGHRVCGHESKCAHLHGHNYRITFTCAPAPTRIEVSTLEDTQPRYVEGSPNLERLDGIGRVVDFSVIKATLCQWLEDNWDHRFLVHVDDPVMRNVIAALDDSCRNDSLAVVTGSLVWVPFNPTAENMARHLVHVIGPALLEGTGVQVIACRVEETRKCTATYHKEL